MGAFFDLVEMTVSSAFGTSSIIPLGAAATVGGVTFLSFASAGAAGGTVVDYSILDTGASEIGTATYTSSNTTLTGRTPTKSTNANAAIVASSAALILGSARAETLGTVQSIATGAGLTGGPITISGTLALSMGQLTNSLAANVNLTVISSYFDGPTVSQGTSGVWFASGSITYTNPAVSANCFAKLWDGTTVMDSGSASITAGGVRAVIALSGFVTNPASNIKISANDPGSSQGVIEFNRTGNSKDSTITVFRIG